MLTTGMRILASFGLLSVVGVGLSGCAGSTAGSAVSGALLPTFTPSTAPTHAPRPTDPPTGRSTDQPPVSERGQARAAVHRYYAVFNQLHRTMEATPLATLFTATCPCQAQAAAVRRAASRGEHYVDHAVINVMRPSVEDRTHAYVLVNLDTSRGGLETQDGTRVTSEAPQRGIQRVFRLVRIHHRWLISRIEAG